MSPTRMIARRIYRSVTPEGAAPVLDNGGAVRCVRPAPGLPAGWYVLRTLRAGGMFVGHVSRFVEARL